MKKKVFVILMVVAMLVTFMPSMISATNNTKATNQSLTDIKRLDFNIDESRGTIEAMNSDSKHDTYCYGELVIDNNTKLNMRIKGRGNSTWNKDKKPYNFTVYDDEGCKSKQKISIFDGVEAHSYSILSNAVDKSCMRNKVAYDLGLNMGIGIENTQVEVYMNNEYLGCYTLTPKNDYKVSKKGIQIELDNRTTADEDQIILNESTTEGVIKTGRYIFTVKEIGDKVLDKYGGKEAALSQIREDLLKMLVAVKNYDSDEYMKYIDIDSWSKAYLLEELVKQHDLPAGSKFFYCDNYLEDKKFYYGPTWDYDQSQGYNGTWAGYASEQLFKSGDGWFIDSWATSESTIFYRDLGKHKSFMQNVETVYAVNREHFNSVVDNLLACNAKYREMFVNNFNKWYTINTGNSSKIYFLNSTKYAHKEISVKNFADASENLRDYLEVRVKFIDDKLYPASIKKPTCNIKGNSNVSKGEKLDLEVIDNADTVSEYAYQWQISSDGKNFEDIEGAKNKKYKSIVDSDINGKYIRCVVTNHGETLTFQTQASIDLEKKTSTKPVKVGIIQGDDKNRKASVDGTNILKIKSGKKLLKLKWKKIKNATGYQIFVSTDKKFKKNLKKISIKKEKITSKTIKKLKSGKKYFVKIRTVNGNKKSSWSKLKTCLVK